MKNSALTLCALFFLGGTSKAATEIVKTYGDHDDLVTKEYRVELVGLVDDGEYKLRYVNSANPSFEGELATIVVQNHHIVSGGSGFLLAGGYPLNGPPGPRVRIFFPVVSGTTWSFTSKQVAVPENSLCTITGEPWAIQRIDEGESGHDNLFTGETVLVTIKNPMSFRNLRCLDHKLGGNQEGCATCSGGQSAGRDVSPTTLGMARYSVHAMLVSLNIEDTPVRYSPPFGPAIDFTVTYNQLDAHQPTNFTYSNLGPKWTFNWLAYVADDPSSQLPQVPVYLPGGGVELFPFNSATPDPQSHAILVKTGAASYERIMPDGSKQIYDKSDNASSYPRRIFMTQIIDRVGNRVYIDYHNDNSFRVRAVADEAHHGTEFETRFYYDLPGDSRKITRIRDPFGRFALFYYANGRLDTITDVIGIQSQFTYLTGTDSIDSLTTPYGTTTFVSGENGTNRWIEITDPLGGKERVEYRPQTPGMSPSDPVAPSASGIVNNGLNITNTFYWNKKAMLTSPPRDIDAQIKHWLLNSDGSVSGTLSSEKQPLENRVWYTYVGQSDYQHAGPSANPSQIARVLGDGSTQLSSYEYNALGKPTKATDPIGRVMSYLYNPANQIDLLEVRQIRDGSNELLRTLTYNPSQPPLHLPVTDTNAAGQTTTFNYNSHGQITARQVVRNGNPETTSYAYSDGSIPNVPAGYLASTSSPVFNGSSAVTSFTYDDFNRVRTVTDSDNYVVTTDYDNLDRKIRVTYPDATFQQFQYTDNVTGAMTLDLTGSRDRRGLWTYRHYNGNEQMDSITDPANRTTLYGWCACGALETIEDFNHHVTYFFSDIQSRIHQKRFADQTTINYLYEGQSAPNTAGATGRLQSSTDAKGQRTNYVYDKDDNVHQINYTNSAGQPLTPPTPSVAFAYDQKYNRIEKITVNGVDETIYDYYPITAPPTINAGKLETVNGPLGNDTITFTYDELGRQLSRSINGVTETVTYDSLGRLSTTDNVLTAGLEPFSRIYDGVTSRLQTLTYPNGQSANYAYFGNNDDRRLQTLQNLASGAVNLSQFDYTYDDEGQITNLIKSIGTTVSVWPFEYDDAKQLVRAGALPDAQFDFVYDSAGNRTSDRISSGSGPIFGSYHVYTANNLNQTDTVSSGVLYPHITIGPAIPLSYDLAGNMTDDANGKHFEWDAANRLVAINYTDTGNRTEFAYDGLGRRVKITEYGSAVTAEVRPKSAEEFTPYSTKEFNLPTGEYVLMFEGLNPNGGNNSALIDGVILNEALVPGGGFENPVLSADTIAPLNSGWNFAGPAGIAARGGDLMTGGPGAPEGDQAAFVANSGAFWQFGTVAPGTYSLSFQAAQAASGNDSSQRVRVTLRGTLSSKRFVWSGSTIAEERDAEGSNVTKRFFAEGEQRIGGKDEGNYYYSRDHLGSIRELTDARGNLVSQYDYDAWGKSIVVSGNMNLDFGYTGHFFHQPSGLNLTMYRAFSPTVGRWISRDPIAEAGGLNLYAYADNNPINAIDPLGLADILIAIAPRYFTPVQLADFNRRHPPGNMTIPINAEENALNDQDVRDKVAEFLRENPLGPDDRVSFDEPDSAKRLFSQCRKYDEILLFAHGNGDPGEEYLVALGYDRIPVKTLPTNCTPFGCTPTEGERGVGNVISDLLSRLRAALRK